jgi:hypothetical protein
MCRGCWEDYGKASIVNDKTRALANAIDDVYECNGAGGNLHVVVDDFNIEDDTVESCRGDIESNRWGDSDEHIAAERRCLNLLCEATVEERASALAIQYGIIDPETGSEIPCPYEVKNDENGLSVSRVGSGYQAVRYVQVNPPPPSSSKDGDFHKGEDGLFYWKPKQEGGDT